MKLKLVASAALLATLSIPAQAGDSKQLLITPTLRSADSGYYVGAYGGAQFDTDYGNERRNITDNGGGSFGAGFNADIPFQKTSSGWGGVGGVKIGYNFEPYVVNESLRLQPGVEGEALYIGTTSTAQANPGIANGAFTEKTSYNSAAWFVNGMLRFKLNCRFTPYIGLGVGGQYITTHSETTSPGSSPMTGLNGSDVDFAFQGLAGFDYTIFGDWDLFTEYKFIDALGTDIKYTNAGNSGFDYRFKPDQIQQHLITAGVKYNF